MTEYTVHNECDTYHVTTIFQNGKEEKQGHNGRQKTQHASHALTDAVYHQASLRLGIADSTMRILYTILDNGERCLLSDVYKQSGISKQTVNSALRKLESGNMVYLENHKGKAKTVCLTDAGKALVQQTAARLYDAERRALETWTGEEIDQHIALLEKYLDALTEQVQAL